MINFAHNNYLGIGQSLSISHSLTNHLPTWRRQVELRKVPGPPSPRQPAHCSYSKVEASQIAGWLSGRRAEARSQS